MTRVAWRLETLSDDHLAGQGVLKNTEAILDLVRLEAVQSARQLIDLQMCCTPIKAKSAHPLARASV